MYTKIIYVIIDSLVIGTIFITISSLNKLRTGYAASLKKAMIAAVIAIAANIAIALSFSELSAQIAYCFYFASIDWILFHLFGFCLSYTDHTEEKSRLRLPAFLVMAADSLSIFLNIFLGHSFYIYRSFSHKTVFFQTGFLPMYYVHLAIDYIAVLFSLVFIIYRIVKTYSYYRIRYILILSVLLLVISLNILYMALALVLDASVIFYGVAGALICFSIRTFVPKSLMIASIGTAVNEMSEGLILFDLKDECIYANEFAVKHFGIDVSCLTPRDEPIATVAGEIGDKNEGTAAYSCENPADAASGTRHYRFKYKKLNDNKGRPICSYYMIEDVTEQVFYLNEIKEARANADKASTAKSSFLANMSHEIRTPLNSILGMNELIMRSSGDPLIRVYAMNISSAGDALLNIVNDVLDFSKIEAGKTEIHPHDYDPYKVLRDCFYFFEMIAEKKNLYLHIKCDPELPSGLYGDSRLIGQILSNIVSNAVKYTNTGGVTLDMTFDETGKDTVDLIVYVTDTGIGIKEEDIPLLFDSFKRVNVEENASIQGTGLGLAITKELLTLMNGSVNVKSEPGHGSRFTVIIPQEVTDHSPIGPLVNPVSNKIPKYKESFKAPDAHILLVDDSDTNLMVVEGLLKTTDIQIDKALNGDNAIERCEHFKYDLILLDHRMPLKDGIETYKIISSSGLNTDTPVIMLTANAISGMDEEYKNIGFCDYLTKPIKSSELEAALMKHLPPEKVMPTS
jgi:CheY-like chemotaxis protein